MAFHGRRKKLSLLMSLFLLIDSHDSKYSREFDQQRILRYDFSCYPQLPINVSWDIHDTKHVIHFHIEAEMKKSHLLGFGFSDRGEVEKADFVLFWYDPDVGFQFKDAHTDINGSIQADIQQDYKLIEFKSTDNDLVIDFERNYETNDPQDYTIDRGTTHVIVFLKKLSQLKRNNFRLTSKDIFINRVQLLKSQLPDAKLPEDTQILHIHVDKVQIPKEETTYWCSLHTLPLFKSKHHIVKFEGSISENTKEIVHHLEIFHCQVESFEVLPPYNAPCSSMSERPPGLERCTKVIGAWAMGANGISYPEKAGAPIGGANFSRYIMLEIHYNNPEHKMGLLDSSGIKFYITKKLRKYDAGVMELGLEYTDKMALPPQLIEWKLHGYCVSKCTQIALPKKGIYIFASQLHAHLTGKRIYTKHFRNGKELPEVNRDDHYSPNYQEIRLLPRIVHIKKGDELVTTCVDQTLLRDNVTLGGFSIYDEMCVNYIHYYPLVDLEVCKSSISTKFLIAIFKFYNDPINLNEGISYNYHAISWNDEKIQDLKTFYYSLPLSVQWKLGFIPNSSKKIILEDEKTRPLETFLIKRFRNLLEGFTREVLRNQPEDIYIFGARYFSLLLTARKENNDDPCNVGGNHEDRFYNAKMWKTDDIATMCSKTLNDAATMIQREYKAMTSARLAHLLSQNASAVEIQRVFRGHKEREYQKTSVEEEMEEELDDGFVIVLEDAEKEMSDAAESLTAAFEGMVERVSSPEIPEEYEEEETEMTTTVDEQVTSLENLDQEQRDPTQEKTQEKGSIVN